MHLLFACRSGVVFEVEDEVDGGTEVVFDVEGRVEVEDEVVKVFVGVQVV